MKKIICYGDSNTFGFNPENCGRYSKEERWSGILAKLLQPEYEVTEAGCNNRTAFFVNEDGILQSGHLYIPQFLEECKDFDIFILALGTNDLQRFYVLDEKIVKKGLSYFYNVIKSYNDKVRLILVPPVILDETVLKGHFAYQFDEKSIELSVWIQDIYKKFAKDNKIEIFDFNEFSRPADADGLHYDIKAHKVIAENLAQNILKAM